MSPTTSRGTTGAQAPVKGPRFMTYRVLIAQSVLTETLVQAPDRYTAEDIAAAQYVEPADTLSVNSWLSDAWEVIDITEVPS